MSADLYARIAALENAVRSLLSRMDNIVTRGTLKDVYDENGIQRIKVAGLYGEELDQVQRWEQFGSSSVPKAGSDVLIVCIGGNRDMAQAVCIASPQDRATAGESGSQVIGDVNGNRIELTSGGIRIVGPVQIEGATVTHNSVNIGFDHKHEDVTVGTDETGEPVK